MLSVHADPIHDAVINADLSAVSSLLENDVDPNAEIESPLPYTVGEWSPLDIAYYLYNENSHSPVYFQMVETLLRYGADPTDLFIEAAGHGDIDMVIFLVEHGYAPKMDAENGLTTVSAGMNALQSATLGACESHVKGKSKYFKVLKYLLEHCPNVCEHINDISTLGGDYPMWTAYRMAKDFDNIRIMNLLVRYGAEPNSDTILHAGIKSDELDMVKNEILRCDSPEDLDINAVNLDGLTALDLANEKGDKELIDLLLSNGATATLKPLDTKKVRLS